MKLTCGVPQGSVVGQSLWNLYCGDVFRIQMPDVVTLIGYADDLALVVVTKSGTVFRHNINMEVVSLIE